MTTAEDADAIRFRRTDDPDSHSYWVTACGVPVGEVWLRDDADPKYRWFIEGDRVDYSRAYSRVRPCGYPTRAAAGRALAVMQSGKILAGMRASAA